VRARFLGHPNNACREGRGATATPRAASAGTVARHGGDVARRDPQPARLLSIDTSKSFFI